jgi:hypothetical protein
MRGAVLVGSVGRARADLEQDTALAAPARIIWLRQRRSSDCAIRLLGICFLRSPDCAAIEGAQEFKWDAYGMA